MKRIVRKLYHFFRKMLLIFKALKKVYKYGGYQTVNITTVNRGEVLVGRNVLVTGGSSGIGFAIAKRAVEEGANVVISGRNESKLQAAATKINSSRLKIIVWDVSKVSEMDQNIEKTKTLLNGDIDILINNAGIVIGTQFPNVTEEDWETIYATNHKGLFFLTQKICDAWMAKKEAYHAYKVINISSQGGFVGATYPYRMTKWDIAGLTQGLGIKLAPEGIIVNGIAPGVIPTEALPFARNQKENVFYPQNVLERFGMPEEIAELAIFLMSNAANFIIGQTIVCDGGYSIK